MIAKKIILAKHFEGVPALSNFKLVEESLDRELETGEFLAEAEWLSVDPYMRNASKDLKEGDVMMGRQVAKIIKSLNEDYPVGSRVVGNFGWRTLTIYKPTCPASSPDYDNLYPLPDMKGLPNSYALGSVGRIGNTAYFGLLRLCDPKPGQTIVISGAAGGVGSLVGQIAKIKGCTVFGFTGAQDKVQWLKHILKFDQAFNYKTADLDAIFMQHAPRGIDAYFDNVGGDFTSTIMKKMKPFGRISLCGAISVYNNTASVPEVKMDYMTLIYKNIKMEGFIVSRWKSEWLTGIHQMRDWILQGKIQVQETVTDGFEKMPEAFIGLFRGSNIGKQIVKV